MTDFAPPMISMTCDRGAKPLVSPCEMNLVGRAGFPPRRGPKRNDAKSTASSGSRRGRRATRPRRSPAGRRSKLAPQAIGIAQNGLANGAGLQSRASTDRANLVSLRGRDAFAQAPVLNEAPAAHRIARIERPARGDPVGAEMAKALPQLAPGHDHALRRNIPPRTARSCVRSLSLARRDK